MTMDVHIRDLLACLSTLLVLVESGRADNKAGEDVHYKLCPEGWTQKMGRCYKRLPDSSSFREAFTQCEGHLPVILDMEDQTNVRDIAGSKEVWLGLYKNEEDEWVWISPLFNNITQQQTGFSKWTRDSSDRRDKCATLSTYNGWDAEYCESSRAVVCVKPAGCDPEWFGVNCSNKCHCYNNPCENPFLQQCPDGCQTGWKGKLCNIPQSQSSVSVSYYCFKGESNYSVFLLIDQKDFSFSSITALDQQGVASPGCTRQSFHAQRWKEHKLYINIHTDGISQFQPPCPAMKVEEGPKLHWQFRLQKNTGVTSVYDEDIHLTCDYTSASPLVVNNEKITTNEITLTTLERKRISAEIYPATYQNLTRLDPSNMGGGQTMVLVAASTIATGQNIRALYPVLCQANSPDGKAVKKLTDENGCGISDLEFDRFHLRQTESGPVYVSGQFLAFTFPGYSSVKFTCQFKPGTAQRCTA